MADWYVWSGATGAGTGANWANAYITLQAATAAKAAGDTFFVAHDHSQTQASALAIAFPGTDTTPNRVYCVNRAGSVPPVAADLRTTALIATTGAFSITITGTTAEINGLIFSAGDAANIASITCQIAAARTTRMVNCALRLTNTGTSSRITPAGITSCYVIWENVTVQFGSVNHRIDCSCRWVWRNTPNAIVGAAIPNVFINQAGIGSQFFFEGVDFSALTGKTMFLSAVIQNAISTVKDCKLATGMTFAIASIASATTPQWTLVRSDSGDTNSRQERHTAHGTLTTETTIVRTGGASDGGATISWKIITTALTNWEMPFEAFPITVWNEVVGAPVTVTVEGIWGGGAVPNSDDIWIDVEYLGTAGFPLGSTATSNKASGLVAGTPLPAGSGTWGGSTTKFKMSATVTPQEKGPITIYVRAGKASSTFYVDPKPVLT